MTIDCRCFVSCFFVLCLLFFVCSFVFTVYNYCFEVTFPCFSANCRSSIVCRSGRMLIQKVAKLMMTDLSLTTDAKLHHLGLLSLQEKLTFNKAVLVFKACRNLAPQYLNEFFICHHNRAPSRSIILPEPRIDLFKTSFSFAGAFLWNAKISQITSCYTLISCRTQQHKWFRNKM